MKKHINLFDTTMRDGSHALSHSYTVEQVGEIARSLDEAGIRYIEIAHGDGLAGSTINYGKSAVDEYKLIAEVRKQAPNAKVVCLMLPGIATTKDIDRAIELGVDAVRVAVHVTEADVGEEHITYAKEKGLFVFSFLMMAHMASTERAVSEAKKLVEYGTDALYIGDSSGHMVMSDVTKIISAMVKELDIPIGFHAHNNLGVGIANAIAAAEAGATFIDGTCRGLGAGAGNAQLEVLNCVLQRYGYETGVDPYKLMDVAQDVVEPIMPRPIIIRTDALMLGVAGIYSSFFLHVRKAAEQYDLEERDIIVELGKRKMVGGQEDKIIEVAYDLAQEKNK